MGLLSESKELSSITSVLFMVSDSLLLVLNLGLLSTITVEFSALSDSSLLSLLPLTLFSILSDFNLSRNSFL